MAAERSLGSDHGLEKLVTQADTEKYLRSALDRLAYVTGLARGLAPLHREKELTQVAHEQMAFIAEAEIRLNTKEP